MHTLVSVGVHAHAREHLCAIERKLRHILNVVLLLMLHGDEVAAFTSLSLSDFLQKSQGSLLLFLQRSIFYFKS